MDLTFEHYDARHFIAQLNELRKGGHFCDVTIMFPTINKQIQCHRNVMASCSPYFRSLFTAGLMESRQVEVEIPGVTYADMERVVQYAYTQSAELTPENIEVVFCTADRLHVLGLMKICVEYLRKHIAHENVIGIMKLARHFSCKNLEEECRLFLLRNFTDVRQRSSEMMQVTAEILKELLESDGLNVESEDEACAMLLEWVRFNPATRRDLLKTLLPAVRLGLLSESFYEEHIFSNPDLLSYHKCKKLIKRGRKLVGLEPKWRKGTKNIHPLLRPRVPDQIIVVHGGWSAHGCCGMMETYDCRVNRWYPNSARRAMGYYGSVVIGTIIYFIGGYSPASYLSTVSCYDLLTKEWTEAAPMHSKRCYVAVTEMEGHIYALGGYDGLVRHQSCERLNVRQNQWHSVGSMNHARSDAGACAYNGLIYVAGGFNGIHCLNSAESYSPVTDQWTLINPMQSLRSGLSLIVLKNRLYAIGGYNGLTRLNTMEHLDSATAGWVDDVAMRCGRSNFACCIFKGKIYVMGGYDGRATTKRVEAYDPNTSFWSHRHSMLLGRSAADACVVSNLANVRDYTFFGRHTNSPTPTESESWASMLDL